MTVESKKEIQIAEFALNGVLFSLLGFVMLGALNLQMKTGVLAWLVTALPGVLVLALSARRCRRHWPCLGKGWTSRSAWALAERIDLATVVAFVAVLGLGGLFGRLAASGFVTMMGFLAVGASALPWWKVRAFQRHLPAACLAVPAGTIAALVAESGRTPWMYYAFCSWAFFLVAAGSAMSAAWRSTPNFGRQRDQTEEVKAVNLTS